MNYLFKTILFSVCILTTSFTVKEDQNKLKTGFYYLAEKETEGELIKDIDSEEWFAVQKEDALAVNEYTAAKFTTRNYLPKAMKVIELKLTQAGKKKWETMKNRISKSGESILFICNDKVYLKKTIIGKNKLLNSTIDLFIDTKYQDAVLEKIKSEISSSK
jgi:hypothetical protein